MTIEQINSVSSKDAVQANEHTAQLLEVFPKQIEIDGFDKYNIKLNDDSKIEQFRLLAYDVESEKLPEKVNQVFQKLSSKFGIYDSVLSDNISNLNYDNNELLEVLNKKETGLNYIWGQDINVDYKNLIKKITLTIKPDVSVNSSLNYSTHSPRILKGVISMFQGSSLFQSSVL